MKLLREPLDEAEAEETSIERRGIRNSDGAQLLVRAMIVNAYQKNAHTSQMHVREVND